MGPASDQQPERAVPRRPPLDGSSSRMKARGLEKVADLQSNRANSRTNLIPTNDAKAIVRAGVYITAHGVRDTPAPFFQSALHPAVRTLLDGPTYREPTLAASATAKHGAVVAITKQNLKTLHDRVCGSASAPTLAWACAFRVRLCTANSPLMVEA